MSPRLRADNKERNNKDADCMRAILVNGCVELIMARLARSSEFGVLDIEGAPYQIELVRLKRLGSTVGNDG